MKTKYRVKSYRGHYYVERCDANGVWVIAQPGSQSYIIKADAEKAMRELQANRKDQL